VLAPLVGRIYSIERIEPLLERARERLRDLDIRNVRFKHGDGAEGWASQGPFDAILMAAAPHALPQKLLDQLAEGGRLVAPVGPEGRQELLRFTRHKDQFLRERLGFVSFVPLLGGVT
jgi:protein-L-isoaspartate(D-aspartate) O-methyltransferase